MSLSHNDCRRRYYKEIGLNLPFVKFDEDVTIVEDGIKFKGFFVNETDNRIRPNIQTTTRRVGKPDSSFEYRRAMNKKRQLDEFPLKIQNTEFNQDDRGMDLGNCNLNEHKYSDDYWEFNAIRREKRRIMGR